MPRLPWFYQLTEPKDLLEALRHDLRRLEEDPGSHYLAYAFCAAADYILYRVYPGYVHREAREHLLRSSGLVRVCSEIARGSRHFEPVSGESTSADPHQSAHPARLLVYLAGEDERELGASLEAVDLAARILSYWEGLI